MEMAKNNLYDNNMLKKGRFNKKSKTTIPLIKVLVLFFLYFLCTERKASLIVFLMFFLFHDKHDTTRYKSN